MHCQRENTARCWVLALGTPVAHHAAMMTRHSAIPFQINSWLALPALLSAACGGPVDTLDTLSQHAEPERSVLLSDAIILFEDDGPPVESCRAGLPSTCPETYTVTYSTRPDRAGGETRAEPFERQTETELSWDGAHLLCGGEARLMRTEPFRFFSLQ